MLQIQASINGLGVVGLPLPKRDAAELGKICHEAPFGKGSETNVDTTVRKTCELNPGLFQIRNPRWEACVQDAPGKAGKMPRVIGLESTIAAELYKILLYEEGAFFDRHREYVALRETSRKVLMDLKARRRPRVCWVPWWSTGCHQRYDLNGWVTKLG